MKLRPLDKEFAGQHPSVEIRIQKGIDAFADFFPVSSAKGISASLDQPAVSESPRRASAPDRVNIAVAASSCACPTRAMTMVPPPLIGEDVTVDIGERKVPFFTVVGRNIAPGSTAGLPVGIEFDGPAGSDRALLAIGLSLERALGAIPAPRI